MYLCTQEKKEGTNVPSFYYLYIQMKIVTDRIVKLLEEEFENTSEFIVQVKMGQDGSISVTVDCDNSITIERCVKLSRMLMRQLEAENLYEDHFTLEVSSPGFTNPFLVPRQYQKNIGKEVEVLLLDGRKIEGLLKEYTSEHIKVDEYLIELDKRNKKNIKKKIVGTREQFFLLKEVKHTKERCLF